jgi:hypothetical protein
MFSHVEEGDTNGHQGAAVGAGEEGDHGAGLVEK